jgi:hypothetical protein
MTSFEISGFRDGEVSAKVAVHTARRQEDHNLKYMLIIAQRVRLG